MRKLIMLAVAGALAGALAGCASMGPQQVVTPDGRDWRTVVTENDRERLRDWRSGWVRGLGQAQRAGFGPQIAKEGVLLQPDSALGGAQILNGEYRCRVLKLGAKGPGLLEFVTYPAFACRVKPERDLQGFAKLSGSQRPVGLIFPGDPLRQVFLGTLVLGDEARAMQYGADGERDLAGFVERIGERRWRLVLPAPRFESLVDVIELVPA